MNGFIGMLYFKIAGKIIQSVSLCWLRLMTTAIWPVFKK